MEGSTEALQTNATEDLLERVSSDVEVLSVLSKLRAGKEPGSNEKELARGAMDGLIRVLERIPPKELLAGMQPYSTFVNSSRLLHILPSMTDRDTWTSKEDRDEDFKRKAIETAERITKRQNQAAFPIERPKRTVRSVSPGFPKLRVVPPTDPQTLNPTDGESSLKKRRPVEMDSSKFDPNVRRDINTSSGATDTRITGIHQQKPLSEMPLKPTSDKDAKRVTLKKELNVPPRCFMGMEFHKLSDLSGVRFYMEADVVDPDDEKRVYKFNLNSPWHCASLNLGQGPDGSPLLSYSDIHCFYELPDGSKWIQHGHFWDADDIKEHARKRGLSYDHLLAQDHGSKELLKKDGIHYSRASDIEYECWVFDGRENIPLPHHLEGDSYYWRKTFDVEQWKLTSQTK